jgi:hypothetical protein
MKIELARIESSFENSQLIRAFHSTQVHPYLETLEANLVVVADHPTGRLVLSWRCRTPPQPSQRRRSSPRTGHPRG